MICEQNFNHEKMTVLDKCLDEYCKNCIFEYIKIKIEDGQVLSIACPNHECSSIISEENIKSIVTPILFEKYILFKNNEQLSKDPSLRWCPKPDCKGYDTGSLNKNELICNVCYFHYCYYCNEE